uniref:Aquaporin 1a (Colton blood group), tandem duplicate 2 n=1 Tax=Salarias fasciatus TaxID=181472 RepID=A0A672GVN7_SALFA
MREVRTMLFWRAVAAEFVGMLLFIFAGLSTIVGGGQPGTALELKVSLSLGHVSGAHLNPAVTLGLMFSCQISAVRCVCYILAQMVGAVTASVIVNSYKPGEALGVNQARLNVGVGAGFIIEFFATLQLVLWGSAPLAIGLSVGLGHFAAISFTGCGINPARSFGPALIQGKMKDHWVYWLAPLCGGMAASLIYDFMIFPQARNLRSRASVLLNGPEDRNNLMEASGEEDSRPGPSHWPKQ